MVSSTTILHKDKHFNVFLNGPDTFALYENHDIGYLTSLINDKTVNASDKRILRKFIKESNVNTNGNANAGVAVIPIHYSKTPNSGQYSTKITLQILSKPIKEKVFEHGGYANLDISNKIYSIVYEVARINGIELPVVKEFNENRDQIYVENAKCWNNSKTVKHNFCALIFRPVHFDGESEFISKLIDELIFVDQIFKHPNYPEYTTAKIIEIYTTLIMNLIVDYLVLNEIITPKFYSLNGDAIYFQPLKVFEIKDIEKHIFQHSNLNIKLH